MPKEAPATSTVPRQGQGVLYPARRGSRDIEGDVAAAAHPHVKGGGTALHMGV